MKRPSCPTCRFRENLRGKKRCPGCLYRREWMERTDIQKALDKAAKDLLEVLERPLIHLPTIMPTLNGFPRFTKG